MTARKPAANLTRSELLQLIAAHVNGRPGFEPGNYATYADLRRDQREATQQRSDAHAMLAAIGWRDSIDADTIRKALQSGGRLTLDDDGRLSYCTGQYYPTEFRAGACRVLAAMLWDYWRDNYYSQHGNHGGAAQYVRDVARRELGRGVASRWFR
jgi:hypothetical protein